MNKKEKLKLYIKKRPERVSLTGVSTRYDWLLILVIGFCITLSGLIYGTILYLSISSGDAFKSDEVSVPEIVAEEKRTKIKNSIKLLNQR